MKKFSREEIEKKVSEILADKLGVDENLVKPDSILANDLGADSLDAVEIVMELEHEFDISITDSDMVAMALCKVSEICDLVEKAL